MTEQELLELERLSAAATAPPWYVEEDETVWELYAENIPFPEIPPPFNRAHPWKIAKCPKKSQEFAEYWPNEADAALIVALRNNAKELIAAARREGEFRGLLERALPYVAHSHPVDRGGEGNG
jgi:hypothetical protein